jgi:hypothetical protein
LIYIIVKDYTESRFRDYFFKTIILNDGDGDGDDDDDDDDLRVDDDDDIYFGSPFLFVLLLSRPSLAGDLLLIV